MPSKEFEKYLSQSTTKEERQQFTELTSKGQEADSVARSNTPNPADAGKPVAGKEDTGKPDALAKYQLRQEEEVKDAGQTLQQNGVAPAEQQQQDQER